MNEVQELHFLLHCQSLHYDRLHFLLEEVAWRLELFLLYSETLRAVDQLNQYRRFLEFQFQLHQIEKGSVDKFSEIIG